MRHISRFERHIDVPEIGLRGQEKLLNSSVLIVGAGGLGSPAALYLAAAGVGTIGIVDDDVVSLSNLQRQVLFSEADVGAMKVDAAKKNLSAISSIAKIVAYPERVDENNYERIISGYDIVLDCTDNFQARYLLNRACHTLRKPLVSASLYHHDGQISVFKSFEGAGHPCYECLYSRTLNQEIIPTCTQAGVVGPVAGVLGTMQASVAINELVGIGETLSGWMFLFSAMGFMAQKVKISKKQDCSCCSIGDHSSREDLKVPPVVTACHATD